MTLEERKYPIGRYSKPESITIQQREEMIAVLEHWPDRLLKTIEDLPEQLLDLSYREEGWTTRQIVHHLADSHMNMYIRLKLGLTADNIVINPYNENAWAAIPEAKESDPFISIRLLRELHTRAVATFRTMSESDFERFYIHPQHGTQIPLWEILPLYTRHANHHLAQILVVANGNGVKQ